MPTFYARLELTPDPEDSYGVAISAAEAVGMAGELVLNMVSITYPPGVVPPDTSVDAALVWEPVTAVSAEGPPSAFRQGAGYYKPREGIVAIAKLGTLASPSAIILQYESAAPVAVVPSENYGLDRIYPPQVVCAIFPSYPDDGTQSVEVRFNAIGEYAYIDSFRFWVAQDVVTPTSFWTRLVGTSETI